MRLIDADALMADIRQNSASYFADDFAHEWVDKQPTITPDMAQVLAYECGKAERKKGKWDFIGFQMFRCTACKHVFSQDSLEGWRTYTYEPTFPNFCPNCGAKMECFGKTEPTFGNKSEK